MTADRHEEAWLEQAAHDVATAEILMARPERDRFSTICYLVQQAAEKAIKAVVIASGATTQ